METKQLSGKAIYSPKGKAGEYAKYACNFYVGCSNNCDYCYCKRGVLGHAMGKPQATLKKCFKNFVHALETFNHELVSNLEELKRGGLFFTFTSDPFIEECKKLTIEAVTLAAAWHVPCKILTKRADFIKDIPEMWYGELQRYIAFGFTLTGHDELEPGASTNAERIETMRTLHKAGFKTFASIEPIIDLESSSEMIKQTLGFCDLYKIGLMSGKRNYTPHDVRVFMNEIINIFANHSLSHPRVYWKDSVLDYIKVRRDDLNDMCWHGFIVGADYNMFNNK